MNNFTPSYITKNRFGIYIFQMKLPTAIRCQMRANKVLLRKSLQTHSRQKALQHARLLKIMVDTMFEKYFDDPNNYKKAKDLLEAYDAESSNAKSFSELEDLFLSGLTKEEEYFLEKIINARSEENTTQKLQAENALLKKNLRKSNNSEYVTQDDNQNNPLISDLMKSWAKDAESSMRTDSYKEYKRMVELFIKIVTYHNQGNVPRIRQLDVELIRKYKETLKAIPKGIKIQNQSIPELVKLNGPNKSPSTIKNTQGNVGHFLGWMEEEGYPIKSNLHRVLTHHPKIKRTDKKERVPFTDEDLKKLFNSEKYTKGKFKRASDYWAPLISLFTGARLGEILQLHKSDIRTINNFHVFDFNFNRDGKTLKVESDTDTKGSARLVPIHPVLIKMGLLDFVESELKIKDDRLFWTEEKNSNDRFGNFSKRFIRYRYKVDAKPSHEMELKDFHSFRHLVRTKLSDIEKHSGIIDDILGHSSSSRSAIGENYNHADRLELKHEAISKIKYNSFDFSIIKNWKACIFNRNRI